jgi:4-hydroxy-3-polyprenylbenzoate decarboxylase
LGELRKLAAKSFDDDDMTSSIASGSFRHNGMIIVPCSVKTLGTIANGIGQSLISRSADVCLKEGFPLVMALRETPLSTIHIENMLKISRAGGRILPISPGFYGHPNTIDDLIDFIVGKMLDSLNIEHSLFQRWGEEL